MKNGKMQTVPTTPNISTVKFDKKSVRSAVIQ